MTNAINYRMRVFFVFMLVFALSGCTLILQKGKRSDIKKIESLSRQLSELEDAKRLLENRLKKEISDKEVTLEMAERGLVITFLADILFNSGKADIRTSAYATLDKIAKVLSENVPDNNVGIEGHTDNVPIKHSGWKSNWELSANRALSVLHYLVDEKGIEGERVSAIGYGEFRPVALNDTKEGRQQNRRVEIVILPKVTKVREGLDEEMPGLSKENLK
ncbi:MAG: flagellar motor protein MotB [Candidatus Omnitrophica bacterium CG11_big_fil_rev_8_21_14_0_20_42_13]|uniref:Flagellar motor protein MotB n=1 Tax=Candidatus Ghiorseimicrobium undicola TaxID=1974746 RepID=A0A2H0LWU8_9BACT|nr:MAG: flagellar motor protein MotB [Candidatus Omnitrophica bacterium CG11_big_fil_rev_8_21_14_0_20_42_13]